MKLALAALIAVCAVGAASADDRPVEPGEAEADRAFHAAEAHADIDAFERLGAARPVTRWTDDAWAEAARIAERTGAYDRARRDLEQAIATATDDQLARRSRAELARLQAFTGVAGQWSAIAATHDRLASLVLGGGDPNPALAELEALVRSNPGYPRAAMAMLVIARGWERDGDADRAIDWLRRAELAAPAGTDRLRATAELVRALTRHGELEAARDELAGIADAGVAAELRATLATAEHRRTVRGILWGLLGAIVAAAVIALRRGAGSWRAVARRLARPPVEVIFFVPIAIVLVAIASTGNPMVARAVQAIAVAGAAIGWLSGVVLDGVRHERGRIGLARAAGHAAVAAVAVAAAAYLAIDHDRMIDLVVETWREGPAMR